MKPTGHLRIVDDLGRIVIPKEIRSQLRIHYEDVVEIFLQDSIICLKKYQPNLGCELRITANILKEKLSAFNSDEPKQKEISDKLEKLDAIADYFSNFKNEMEADNNEN